MILKYRHWDVDLYNHPAAKVWEGRLQQKGFSRVELGGVEVGKYTAGVAQVDWLACWFRCSSLLRLAFMMQESSYMRGS